MWKSRHQSVKKPVDTLVYAQGVKITHRIYSNKSMGYKLTLICAWLLAQSGPVKPQNVHKLLLIYCLSIPGGPILV